MNKKISSNEPVHDDVDECIYNTQQRSVAA